MNELAAHAGKLLLATTTTMGLTTMRSRGWTLARRWVLRLRAPCRFLRSLAAQAELLFVGAFEVVEAPSQVCCSSASTFAAACALLIASLCQAAELTAAFRLQDINLYGAVKAPCPGLAPEPGL